MSDEVATLRTIVAHRAFVSSYLHRFADATSFQDALWIQVGRFSLTEEQVWLINMIVEEIG